MKFKNKAKFKATLLSATAIATSLLIGMTAACSNKGSDSDDDEKTVTKQDVQVIKNGNFEFYDDNDGLYPISNPDNWTSGSSGSSSSAMGGVINTSKERWDYITDKDLPATLESNNDLESGDENKKDYNGALTDDLPYKNTHDAVASKDEDEDVEDKRAYIDNPFTHKYSYNEDGDVIDLEGKVVTTYVNDEDGKTYLDEEYTQELETSVLMLHNYRAAYYKGTETYYSSSSMVTLPARTAAKISVWVKTSELYFDGAQNSRTKVENEHGAYIRVNTSVSGNALDAFYIRNINTEILNPYDEESGEWTEGNNGWVQYTVFVQASSFASTTVSITLGLGQNEIYTVEGYAFFDDIELTTYDSADEMVEEFEETAGEGKFATTIANSTSNLLSPDVESEFRVDKVKFKTNNDAGEIEYLYNSADRHFYIDLTSSATEDYSTLLFDKSSVAAGFTVEQTTTGKFVSSKNTDNTLHEVTKLDNGAGNAYLPANFTGKRVTDDILATFDFNTADGDWKFDIPGSTGRYNAVLTDALASATSLPGADGNTTALIMLSANGAAYEAELTNPDFELKAGEYVLISFWLKTSDMDGKTAATVTVKEVTDDKSDNSSNFSLDTTTLNGVTINDEEDVYNGWAECFVRIENTSKENNKKFKLCFNFGNTTISGTSDSNYKAGWVAVTNASMMKLHESVYGYTSGLENSASLTLSDDEKAPSISFDTEQGDKNEIKSDLAIPNSYTGVNGGSAEVGVYNTTTNEDGETQRTLTDYDETNRNDFAGLLNKENLDNYKGCAWFSAIEAIKKLNQTNPDANNDTIWNTLAGKYSVQPLLIVNTLREFKDKAKAIYNYGYIGNDSSVSANGYTAVSVRVFVSEGAIASVYLIDTDPASKQTLTFSLPKFTFWYDDDGNVLKSEPKKKASAEELKNNIAYTLRSDGLYDSVDKDGKLYANFYNLAKKFKDYDFEYETFYNEKGEKVIFENLVDGENYYVDAQKTDFAPHYLVAGDTRVYKYNAEINTSLTYYYLVNGAVDTSKVVYGLDTSKATMRYDNTVGADYPYQFTIDTTTEDGAKYADKWVTVTFYLHAGSREKKYKLELWSGYRDQATTAGVKDGSYVLFDHSSISLNQTNYKSLVDYYTQAIIDAYKGEISGEQDELLTNITDYEKQLSAEKVEEIRGKAFNYIAKYYTYTLYDSDLYVPFNADTAKADETGYAYNYSDYSEALAYLKVEDVTVENTEYSLSMFIDYSNFDKDISLGKSPSIDNVEDPTTSVGSSDGTNFWLLLSSILLLVAIAVALLVIAGREVYKRLRRTTVSGKNTYNFNKNRRYVRQYVKANGEITKPEVEEGNMDESLLVDKEPEEAPVEEEPAEEVPAEETVEQAPVEEGGAEQSETPSAEEVPAEQTPADEAPAQETPSQDAPAEGGADGENK